MDDSYMGDKVNLLLHSHNDWNELHHPIIPVPLHPLEVLEKRLIEVPVCCVQWIGYSRYLSPEFVSALPHPICGVMAIGDNPLAILTK
jgi:hypothetical protein